ncbi:MAG: L-histidine N(alpha)-methyltransferase [Cytophagales bacterium]|nr:L-histidine N(alpha)-methyltransferase [Cytophagales bacterium]
MIRTFAKDVEEGLSAKNKSLPSRYFYDEAGDRLFVEIMKMPEYYLTDCELEIFNYQTKSLIDSFGMNGEHFRVVELGAGDGLKVIHLLRSLNGCNFTYAPIDISQNALTHLKNRLLSEIPSLDFDGKQGEYFDVLDALGEVEKKVILFLGSNIGNLTDSRAHNFMLKISQSMNVHDKLLIGFDLKKDPDIIELAYDDPHGFTREFNLNLLRRINRELEGDFEVEKFAHVPEYDPNKGIALSYLESLEEQVVEIKAIGKSFEFYRGERIHTEISRKYDLRIINKIAKDTRLRIVKKFYDSRRYFVDVLFEKE